MMRVIVGVLFSWMSWSSYTNISSSFVRHWAKCVILISFLTSCTMFCWHSSGLHWGQYTPAVFREMQFVENENRLVLCWITAYLNLAEMLQ